MKISDFTKVKKNNKPRQKIPAGFILWSGVSPVDNAPIVAIATIESKNKKTGNMIQVWIMRSDIEPNLAAKKGLDLSVCGGCPFSGRNGCYVRLEQAPLQIFKSFKKGNYPVLELSDLPLLGIGREIRIGAYGDPAMVPVYVWEAITKNSNGWTGYTHQHNESFFDSRLTKFLMVSANTIAESKKLNAIGIRTFTAIGENEEVPEGQLVCPNTTHSIQCRDCKLCDGGNKGKSIVVEVHGIQKNKFMKNR